MKPRSDRVWFGALLLLCLLLRGLLLATYEAQVYPDTGTYFQATRDWLSGDYALGQGRRTLGWPLVIALLGESPQALWLANALVGVLTSLLLFHIALRLTGSAPAAFVAGALHSLNLQQLVQEATLLTESFSAFTVVATLWLFVLLAARWRAGRLLTGAAVLLGLLAGWALMVRPQFIFLPLLLPLGVLWAQRAPGRRAALRSWRSLLPALAIGAPAALLVLAWAAHLQHKTGHFTMSTQSGFGMVNHTIAFIERAPDRYATARDVLLRVRQARLAEAGHWRNTIWYAWPELQRVTGWSLPEASRELQRMNNAMIANDPGRYAASVASAWVDFWTVPIFWQPEQIKPGALGGALQGLWWVEHKLLRAANLAFVLLLAALAVPAVVRRLRWDLPLSVLALTVVGSSLIQALADQGASSRYSLPTQSVVLLVLLVAVQRWRTRAG